MIKLKEYNSNKAIYSQTLFNNKVLFSKKELTVANINLPLSYDNSINYSENILKDNSLANNLVKLYNENKIKYNTLQYLLAQNKPKKKVAKNFLKKNTKQLLIEYSIESGLV